MRRASDVNRRYFREAYRTGVHGWETDEPSPYAVDFLRQLAQLLPGASLLDIGCGEGRHAIAAAKLGFRVAGIDAEELAIERARQRAEAAGLTCISFRREQVDKLGFPAAEFDVVFDYGCLHHQPKSEWTKYRNSILNVLRPEGFYVVSVFAPEFRLFAGQSRPWHIAQGAYRRCFTRSDLEQYAAGRFDFVSIQQELPAGFWHILMKRR